MMRANRTARLGDLIVAVFDEAALCSTDPKETSWLATRAVWHLVRREAGSARAPKPRQ